MTNNTYKNLFDLNFRHYEDLRNLSAKYEAKIGVSINCLNCSIAIWAITTTILFNTPSLPFIWTLIYIVFSVLLGFIVILGWVRGFFTTQFENFDSFKLDSNVNKKFLEQEDNQNQIYEEVCEDLLKGIRDFDKILQNRKQNAKATKCLSIIALIISIFLVWLVIIGKINEIYDFKIKPQICITECNDLNLNNTGAINENRESEE
jgi:hypothetical protein